MLSTSVVTAGGRAISNKLVYERRIGARNQIEVVVPFTVGDGSSGVGSGWGGGIGDLTLGMKRAVAHSLARGAIVSAAAEIILPVGDETLGLSKGTAVFEPFLAVGQILPADGFLHAQAGIELPFDHDVAPREAFWRIAVGRSFSQHRWGRTWSPMVELLAARELESGQVTHWDLAPQMQVTLSTRQHVMASGGIRFPLERPPGTAPADPRVSPLGLVRRSSLWRVVTVRALPFMVVGAAAVVMLADQRPLRRHAAPQPAHRRSLRRPSAARPATTG